ncbi:MAG: CheR family methyltransferase, partial [Bacteroidota bacterium]|nr:CheR family methyltransferase [Bacteroidota bacterium]
KVLVNSLYSKLFRDDANWSVLTNFIVDNYPKGANIRCYACSDGSEPYTIILSLIKQLGKTPKKLFPIIAQDIDTNRIIKNKKGIIGLTDKDFLKIEECLKGTNIQLTDIFEKDKTLPSEKGVGADGQVFIIQQYRVKDLLKNLLRFSSGNIIEETRKKVPENSVILFRNVWPFLTPHETSELINNFDMNISKNTSIIIGGFDKDYSYVAENLMQRGFSPIDQNEPISNSGMKFYYSFPSNVSYKEKGIYLPSVFIRH